jgi:hypothetical protein
VTNGEYPSEGRESGLHDRRICAKPSLESLQGCGVIAVLEGYTDPAQMRRKRFCRFHIGRVLKAVRINPETVITPVLSRILEFSSLNHVEHFWTGRLALWRTHAAFEASLRGNNPFRGFGLHPALETTIL